MKTLTIEELEAKCRTPKIGKAIAVQLAIACGFKKREGLDPRVDAQIASINELLEFLKRKSAEGWVFQEDDNHTVKAQLLETEEIIEEEASSDKIIDKTIEQSVKYETTNIQEILRRIEAVQQDINKALNRLINIGGWLFATQLQPVRREFFDIPYEQVANPDEYPLETETTESTQNTTSNACSSKEEEDTKRPLKRHAKTS